MLRVLHSSTDEQLRALRHQILARVDCEVVSLPPQKAVLVIANEPPDVLVVCSQMAAHFADALCGAFRRANPYGRLVAIVSSGWGSTYEADLVVDAHTPEALVSAVLTYPAMQARFKHARQLMFVNDGKWIGWTCERCCWNVRLQDAVSKERIRAAFETHSCEVFARGTWLGSTVQDAH